MLGKIFVASASMQDNRASICTYTVAKPSKVAHFDLFMLSSLVILSYFASSASGTCIRSSFISERLQLSSSIKFPRSKGSLNPVCILVCLWSYNDLRVGPEESNFQFESSSNCCEYLIRLFFEIFDLLCLIRKTGL